MSTSPIRLGGGREDKGEMEGEREEGRNGGTKGDAL